MTSFKISPLPEDLTQDDPRSHLDAKGRHTLIFQKKMKMEMDSTVYCGQTTQGCDAVGGVFGHLAPHDNLTITAQFCILTKNKDN